MKALLRRWLLPENEGHRHRWVRQQLACLPSGQRLLDAGCGTQPYRADCAHLSYEAQDFGQYTGQGGDEALHDGQVWHYGKLDYTGDIWQIAAPAARFDAILCTEVFEHIPYPIETLAEFSRLLKPGGVALLTVPVNCIPHQTPYFFTAGLSKEWYEFFAAKFGLEVMEYRTYSGAANFLAQELIRLVGSLGGVQKLLVGVAVLPFLLLRPFLRHVPEYPCIGAFIKLRKLPK
jgi:SAM-dependent methyltransferase